MSRILIYCTINKINGKRYVGQTEKNPPGYLGSGKILSSAISKYGKQNFRKVIIEVCNNKKLANKREKYWISRLESRVPNGYNIAPGGTGGDTITKHPDRDRICDQMSKNIKKSWTNNRRKSQGERCKKVWTRENVPDNVRKWLGEKAARIRKKKGSYLSGTDCYLHSSNQTQTERELRAIRAKIGRVKSGSYKLWTLTTLDRKLVGTLMELSIMTDIPYKDFSIQANSKNSINLLNGVILESTEAEKLQWIKSKEKNLDSFGN